MDEQILEILRQRHPELPQRARRFVEQSKRPRAYARSLRVSAHPLRHTGLGKLFGGSPATPKLSVLTSKFGGVPYEEGDGLSATHEFLGQLAFADFDAPRIGFPSHGILAIWAATELDGDPPFRALWYPDASEERYTFSKPPRSRGNWETRLDFSAGSSVPEGKDWMTLAAPHLPDDELHDVWHEYGLVLRGELSQTGHRVGGHRCAGLWDGCLFDPPDGLDAWEMVIAIDYDTEAGFGWGSNVVYVLVPGDDLQRGDLSAAIVTSANY